MWSYSSCAKLHQQYNVLTVFFIGIKDLCNALADNAWFTANPEDSFHRLRLDAISIPDFVIKKGRSHGARHGKTEVHREYHFAWNAWKRCCKKVDSKVNILHVFTIDFSATKSIVNHNSQSDGQNKSSKSEMNLRKKTIHTNSLQRKIEDTKDNGILLWTKQAKMGLRSFDLNTGPLSWWKIAYTTNQENQLKNPSIQVNKDAYDKDKQILRRLLVQRSSWSTYRMAMLAFISEFLVVVRIRMELKVSSQFVCSTLCFLLQLVSFTADSDAL